MTHLRMILIMVLSFMAASAPAQIKDNETIVFLGDSITEQGTAPHGYVTLFRETLEKSRPNSSIQVVGAGISGNKVPDLEDRLDRDVLRHNPAIVMIFIGTNDVWHSTRNMGTPIDRYESGLRNLVRRCQDADARVVVVTPAAIGEKTDGTNQLHELLEQYVAVSRKVAMETTSVLLDLRTAFISHLREYNTANAENGVLTTDGVHLNDAGNRFVAVRMLEAVGEIPARTKVLRHIVLFKFKTDVSAAQKDEVNRAFQGLRHQIPEISDFERGTNNSPEGLDKGFTHGYQVTFASDAARSAYLPHPAHKRFVELLDGKIDDVFVFDYWVVE